MKIIRSCEECPAGKYSPAMSGDWYYNAFRINLGGSRPFVEIPPNCRLQDASQSANAADAEYYYEKGYLEED